MNFNNSLAISNDRSVYMDLVIEPLGNVLPFPSGITYTMTGDFYLGVGEDRVVVYSNDSGVTILLGDREIYSSGLYSITKLHSALLTEIESIFGKLKEFANQAIGKPQPTNDWSLRTIVVHMIVVDTVIWLVRLKSMAEQDNPRWQWTEPDLAEWEKRYESLSLDNLLEEFSKTRKGIVDHLTSLDESGWNRIGTHATFGQMDVAGVCARILEHDNEHLEELRKRAT